MSRVALPTSRLALIPLLVGGCAQMESDVQTRNGMNVPAPSDATEQKIKPDRSPTQIPAEIDPPPADVDPT